MTDTSELGPEAESSPPAKPVSSPAPKAPNAAPRRRPWLWLALLVVLTAGSLTAWQMLESRRVAERRLAEWQDVAEQLDARLVSLDRRLGSENERGRALETKQSENQANLRVMREELLGMTERAALLEDAVNRLTAQRESAVQTLRLSEIEFLLSFAEQRLQLFADLPTALRALTLAADGLNSIEEPAFAPLKQTLAAEIEQLRALSGQSTETARRRLAELMLGVEQLPRARERRAAEEVEQARWKQILDQLVRVRPLSEGQGVLTPLERATRVASLRLQLGLALAALDRGQQAQLRQSIELAQQDYRALFDAEAAQVVAGQSLLDQLQTLELSPKLPTMGTTLRELRAIRAARSATAQSAISTATSDAAAEVERQ